MSKALLLNLIERARIPQHAQQGDAKYQQRAAKGQIHEQSLVRIRFEMIKEVLSHHHGQQRNNEEGHGQPPGPQVNRSGGRRLSLAGKQGKHRPMSLSGQLSLDGKDEMERQQDVDRGQRKKVEHHVFQISSLGRPRLPSYLLGYGSRRQEPPQCQLQQRSAAVDNCHRKEKPSGLALGGSPPVGSRSEE